jgi:hypothetical protein
VLKDIVVKLLKGRVAQVLPALLRACADGDLGPQAKAIYWALAGKKTYIGIGLAVAAFALEKLVAAPPDYAWETWTLGLVYSFSGIFFAAGLVDDPLRQEPPKQ